MGTKRLTQSQIDRFRRDPDIRNLLETIARVEESPQAGAQSVMGHRGPVPFTDEAHPWDQQGPGQAMEGFQWFENEGKKQTPAGRWQINHGTSKDFAWATSPNDPPFSTANQERMVVAMLERDGAIDNKGQIQSNWSEHLYDRFEGVFKMDLERGHPAALAHSPVDSAMVQPSDYAQQPAKGNAMTQTSGAAQNTGPATGGQPNGAALQAMPTPDQQTDQGRADLSNTLQFPTLMSTVQRRTDNNARRQELYDIVAGANAPEQVQHIRDPYENKMAFVGAILRGKTDEALTHSTQVATRNAAIDRQNEAADLQFMFNQTQTEAALLNQTDRVLLENYDRASKPGVGGAGGGGGTQRAGGGGGGDRPWLTRPQFGAQGQTLMPGSVDLTSKLPKDIARPELDPTPQEEQQHAQQVAADWWRYDDLGSRNMAVIRNGLNGVDMQNQPLKGKAKEAAYKEAATLARDTIFKREIPDDMKAHLLAALEDQVGVGFSTMLEALAPETAAAGGAAEAGRPKERPEWMRKHLRDEGAGLDPFLQEPDTRDTGADKLSGRVRRRSLTIPSSAGTRYESEEARDARRARQAERDLKPDPTPLATKMAGDNATDMQLNEMIGQGWQDATTAAGDEKRWLTSDQVSSIALTAGSFVDTSLNEALSTGGSIDDSLAGALVGKRKNGEYYRLSRGRFSLQIRRMIKGEGTTGGAAANQFTEMLRNVGSRRSGVIIKQLWEQMDTGYIKFLNNPASRVQGQTQTNEAGFNEAEVMDLLFGGQQ